MAYDRFIALLCHPLHYATTMRPQYCITSVPVVLIVTNIYPLIYTVLMSTQSFCASFRIHIFCELYANSPHLLWTLCMAKTLLLRYPLQWLGGLYRGELSFCHSLCLYLCLLHAEFLSHPETSVFPGQAESLFHLQSPPCCGVIILWDPVRHVPAPLFLLHSQGLSGHGMRWYLPCSTPSFTVWGTRTWKGP